MPLTAPPDRPNFLVVLADQFRHDYLHCRGASFLRTPNLDRIASRGVVFAQCCTNAPVCAPARIGLAAGQQPVRLGALDNQAFLPLTARTYYQRLRDHGYRVGCVGKLDLAKPDRYNGRYGDRPCVYAWGFTHPEECEGKMHAGSSPTPLGPYTHWLAERGLLERFCEDYRLRREKGWNVGACHDSVLPADAFEDVYIGRRAAEWLARVPDDFPWHAFVSFVGPHDPFDPPTEYAKRCRRAAVPPAIRDELAGKPGWVRRRAKAAGDDEVAQARRQYCAAIEAIDDQVGLMLDVLADRGMLDNTWVFFSSDHGEMLGDHGLWTKSTAYEAALRVPLIAAGPGVEAGTTSDALIELIDLNPTICELAGAAAQENIDARSFAGILRRRQRVHRPDAVSALRHFRCIRTEQYKLIHNHGDCAELYDLQTDPDERNNIADERPDIAAELGRRMVGRFLEGKWRR